jgi:DNA polymerase-1
MQNASYDIGFGSSCWNLPVPEKIDDTSAMAYMIDEQMMSYGLDALCRWRGMSGKDERTLREAAAAYGVEPKGRLHKLPARYVGDYAEQDARATLLLYESMLPDLEEQGLRTAYDLEMDLVPVVHEMQRRGVRVDVDAAEQLYERFKRESQQALADLSDHLSHTTGIDDLRQTKWLERAFDSQKIVYPQTPTGAGSFRAQWMREVDHWLPRLVLRAKSREDAAEKFIRGYILGYMTPEKRLHASVHQYRAEVPGGDDDSRGGGTRTYRFAYSDPPLQQMPHRDEELSEIRRCFVPEKGEKWLSADVSQQEYRIFVHYAELAKLPRAKEAGDKYRSDPKTDFHQWVADMTGLARKPAKDSNFAKIYGAGVKKFALMIKKPEAEAERIMRQYDENMPFASMLARQCSDAAERRGYIKLLDGARIRFDWWFAGYRKNDRSTNWGNQDFSSDCRGEEARRRVADPTHPWYGERPRRSRVHKALNSLVQGGAARHTKMMMRACARVGHVPLLQIHDELCFSIKSVKVAATIKSVMQDAVQLTVPVLVDAGVGDSWGGAK